MPLVRLRRATTQIAAIHRESASDRGCSGFPGHPRRLAGDGHGGTGEVVEKETYPAERRSSVERAFARADNSGMPVRIRIVGSLGIMLVAICRCGLPPAAAADAPTGSPGFKRGFGEVVVQLRTVRRVGYRQRPPFLSAPRVIIESHGRRDSTDVAISTGRAEFASVHQGRATIRVRLPHQWTDVDLQTIVVGSGQITRDTLFITSSIPEDTLRAAIEIRAGIVSSHDEELYDW